MAFSFGTPAAAGGGGGGFSFGAASSAAATTLRPSQSTPLFGAVPGAVSTPAFGAPASSAAASPFSFATSQPASTPSLFGAQPASTPSLFGAQPASTPSLFGAQPASTPSLFGAQPAQAAQAAAGPSALAFGGGAAPAAPDLSAIRELESIKDSYVPGPANQRYRFQHLLLNVVDNPAARVKPAGVDELQWREALQRAGGADNPDHLWPVLAQGFKDLLGRKAAQDAAIKEHSERLESLGQMAAQLASRQEAVLRDQLEAVRRRHVQLCHQLLRVLRHIDALEGRFAQAVGCRGATPREVMQRLSTQLGEIEAGLAPSAANGGGLQGRVKALAAAARLRAGAPGGGGVAEVEGRVDEEQLEQLFGILAQYTEAMGKLGEVLRRDERAVGILEYAAASENGDVIMG
ncbi:nuclear pore complex NUP54 [Micractinium conductrix]|uniref:Nuclear pore complex NUP54 n=1 Tax=Micractinium conductrix TaxID=554055 RepID=A0A2P6VHF5_9CHLO|nr:nuclear pore complex NUP54 [Micractinium conductrix]|eukprot:PSC73508.1 nuclear pore complex NUP54 [Micractinium conductrix]